MIAAPVQCDVDGIPKGSHYASVPPMGYARRERDAKRLLTLINALTGKLTHYQDLTHLYFGALRRAKIERVSKPWIQIEELRQRQYQDFLEESGDTISRSEFETLIWFPGVTDEQVRIAGGLKRALAKQKAL